MCACIGREREVVRLVHKCVCDCGEFVNDIILVFSPCVSSQVVGMEGEVWIDAIG